MAKKKQATGNLIRDRVRELRRVPANQLIPHPLNWRTHSPEQANALDGLLSEVGFAGAVLARELPDGTLQLIDGHLRTDRMKDAEVPVLILDVTEAEAAKILATYDPLGAMAGADAAKLDELLASVQTDNAALATMLETLAEKVGLESSEVVAGAGGDEFDSTPQESGPTRTQVGDVWLIGGKHRLMVGDSTDAGTILLLMNGKMYDMLFTSPPYNSGDGGYKTDYNGKTKKFYVSNTDDRTESEWVSFCNLVLSVAAPHAHDVSPVVWNVMYTARCRAGYGRVMFAGTHPFVVRETLCWDKAMGFPVASRGILSRNWELIFVLSLAERYTTTQGENEVRWAKWDIPRPQKQHEEHRATFPTALADRAITDFSLPAALVYDPFLGSGTTLIAAHRLNRTCYGCEIEPKYGDVILKRAEAEGLTCEKVEG